MTPMDMEFRPLLERITHWQETPWWEDEGGTAAAGDLFRDVLVHLNMASSEIAWLRGLLRRHLSDGHGLDPHEIAEFLEQEQP